MSSRKAVGLLAIVLALALVATTPALAAGPAAEGGEQDAVTSTAGSWAEAWKGLRDQLLSWWFGAAETSTEDGPVIDPDGDAVPNGGGGGGSAPGGGGGTGSVPQPGSPNGDQDDGPMIDPDG